MKEPLTIHHGNTSHSIDEPCKICKKHTSPEIDCMANVISEDVNVNKCSCKYDKHGEILGVCLRCLKVQLRGGELESQRILVALEGLKEEIPKHDDHHKDMSVSSCLACEMEEDIGFTTSEEMLKKVIAIIKK